MYIYRIYVVICVYIQKKKQMNEYNFIKQKVSVRKDIMKCLKIVLINNEKNMKFLCENKYYII